MADSIVTSIVSSIVEPLVGPLVGKWGGGASPIKALFAAGVRGFAFTPWDITTLFQDSAGTTPVAADGDPVGLMKDVSGLGNHATSSGSKRPTYKTSGGLSWLQADGVDDSMQIASLALTTTMHEWLAYDQTGGGGSPFMFEHSATANTNPGHYFRGTNGNSWTIFRTSNRIDNGISVWANGLHVSERSYVAATTGAYKKDGVVQTPSPGGIEQAETVATAAYNLFSRNQASLFSAGRYFGHILADGSAADNVAIYNLLKAKAGL